MKFEQNCWLLLEKSDETRISKSISGYQDKTGEEYNYDSLVPNHKNLRHGDLAIIRKEDKILGYGVIGDIKERNAVKHHQRCPNCKSTDIRERKSLSPKWKCGKCASEFSETIATKVDVRQYKAAIESFVYFENPPAVQLVKNCAASGSANSQLSMLDLDPVKLQAVLEGVELPGSVNAIGGRSYGQGIGLSFAERKAVELHAMQTVAAYYAERGWEVLDKSASSPFDLLARKDHQKRFIEVKGSTGEGNAVILTHGEVRHAKEHCMESVLVVVAHIKLRQENSRWVASGGKIVCHQDPWSIVMESLLPIQFWYELQNVPNVRQDSPQH